MIKDWFAVMFEENIEDAKAMLDKEKSLAKASPDREELEKHLDNIADIQKCITFLEEVKEKAKNL